MSKKMLGKNVYIAAKERISWTFDNFKKVCVSFSGGKDSTAMLHMVMDEAIKRNVKVAVMFLDWECQYETTINHVRKMFDLYKENIIPFWVAIPILSDNSCSQFEPEWIAWDEAKKDLWTREKDRMSIADKSYFPFYYEKITFEEFVPLFGNWYGGEDLTAILVGIRTQESLNRYRTLANTRKKLHGAEMFTTGITETVFNVYPIYDWTATDDWIYFSKHKKCYNEIYDRMYQAGLTIHQMRIDEPFGATARKGLWMYQIIEPQTWAKMILRLSGVNTANLYSKEMGNILGNGKISLPKNHTWKSFSEHLIKTMPLSTANHYLNKITVYLKWYESRGYLDGIPDESDYKLEQLNKVPSWRRICRTLLRNDYWCKGIGFSPTKTSAYSSYLNMMKKRKEKWNINIF